MASKFEITVEHEDGAIEEVVADQRDCVAFELKHKVGTIRAMEELTFFFMQWIAWHALKRQKTIDKSYDTWASDVVEVRDTEAESVDPGKPEALEESTSI